MNYSDQQILDKFFPIDKEEYGLSQKWEDIIKDLKPYSSEEILPGIIYWKKNGYSYFKQNKNFKTLWCNKQLVWKVLENKDKPNFEETKSLIKNLMLSHDEWKDYEPHCSFILTY